MDRVTDTGAVYARPRFVGKHARLRSQRSASVRTLIRSGRCVTSSALRLSEIRLVSWCPVMVMVRAIMDSWEPVRASVTRSSRPAPHPFAQSRVQPRLVQRHHALGMARAMQVCVVASLPTNWLLAPLNVRPIQWEPDVAGAGRAL